MPLGGRFLSRHAVSIFLDPLYIVSVKNEDLYRVRIRPHGYTR